MGFIAGFHTVATLAFIAGSALVAVRLVGLSRRTGQEPELLLGGAIGCTAVLGYGVLIANLLVRGTTPPEQVPAFAVFLTAAGKTLHDVGVTMFLVFIVRVFRRDETWAKLLAGAMLASLWGGLVIGAWRGGFRYEMLAVGTWPWRCEYAVIWSYPVWSSFEAYRYWLAMRKRIAIGLADPLVANRFFLWGTGSLFSMVAIWTASIPYLFVSDPAEVAAITPVVRIVTALAGVGSVSCSLFAFLPPAWYKRMIEPLLTRAAGATSR